MSATAPTVLEKERACVRDLAAQIFEIAREPRMEAIRRRWRDVNALRTPDRAPVWCKPVGCWKEILPPDRLVCADPWLRELEYGFRQVLHKRDIDDDTPVEPWFGVPAVFDVTPENTWGVEIRRHDSGVEGGAWAYDPPLANDEAWDRLARPTYRYNPGKTAERAGRAADLFGDILPVREVNPPRVNATLGTPAANLRGLEGMMLDMLDAPERLHRLMAHLRDAELGRMDAVEAAGPVTPNTDGPMICSDPVRPAPDDGRTTHADTWCMANSQEFDQVSPAMWEEFCLDYQKPLFARSGRVAYGCCENLTRKIDGVLSIPNLRIFVCSAWTHLETVLDRIGRDYCIMWRQKASDVVFPDSDDTIRRDLLDGARRLRGRPYQIVLRELETLRGHPDRLHVWTRCAKEAAEAWA